MRKEDRYLRICGVLLAANLLFIWGNSLLPAELSRALSDFLRDLLMIGGTGTGAAEGSHLLRKLAHFLEFASLGLLLGWHRRLRGKTLLPAFLWGAAAACLDETIQIFVPGRGPGLKDVGIDACGVLAGILVLKLGIILMNKYKSIGG